jgi:hypothetical protein
VLPVRNVIFPTGLGTNAGRSRISSGINLLLIEKAGRPKTPLLLSTHSEMLRITGR